MFQALRKLLGASETLTLDLPKYTPDIWRLEQYHRQPLFVCGDVVERNLAKEASFVGRPEHPTCYTHGEYTLWKKDLGDHSYPVILPKEYKPEGYVRYEVEPARIRGELWNITPSQFILLDNHKQNGVKFRRERIMITCPYYEMGYSKDRPLPKISDRAMFTTIEAWAYMGITEYWNPQIGGLFASAQIEVTEAGFNSRRFAKKFYQFE